MGKTRSRVVGDFIRPDTDHPKKKAVYVHIDRGQQFPDDDPMVLRYGYAFELTDAFVS